MEPVQPIPLLFERLWRHISPRRRWQFGVLLALMVIASVAEILSIGAVLPFLGALTAPDKIFENRSLQPLVQMLGLVHPGQLLLPLTIAFVGAACIAGVLRLLLLWASTRLSFAAGADISLSIYRRTLYQPYTTHCARNSSEVINGISNKASGVIYSIIVPTLTLVSSCVMLVFILAALLSVDPVVALLAFFGFGFIYLLIIGLTRKQLLEDSQRVARESTHVIKSLQEGLGGIRDVLIDGSQDVYCKIYRDADLPLRRAQGNSLFISICPRYAMEALGMSLIAVLAYFLAYQTDGIEKAIPVLGALALGAQRLLPILQQGYGAWSAIRGGQASLQDTLDLLDQPLPDYASQPSSKPLPFNSRIDLNQISFRYSHQSPFVLKNIKLSIAKGERVGVIGATGSGKSTLLDIVMGLLQPTDGALEIDGIPITNGNHRAWQTHITHVPQAIFLADSSIEANIAFGVPEDSIDHNRVRQVARQAQIAESIESWSEQYQTLVGERGVRLSGGQRQRIGIARALYKQADVIIFDEATSALDNATENAVMESIEMLNSELTIFIIAHRLTTLKNCTMIIELDQGEITRVGSYQNIVNCIN